MNITDFTTLISSVGFPIAACIAIFWQMNRQSENHKTEMDHLTEALHNNTVALSELSTLIKGKKEE